MKTIETVQARGGPVESHWSSPRNRRFRVLVNIGEDEDGGFYIYTAELPGVASQGDTVEDAIDNLRDAFRGVVASYANHGERIPWLDSPRPPADEGEEVRLVDIDVEEEAEEA